MNNPAVLLNKYNEGFHIGAKIALSIFHEVFDDTKLDEALLQLQAHVLLGDPTFTVGYDAGMSTYIQGR